MRIILNKLYRPFGTHYYLNPKAKTLCLSTILLLLEKEFKKDRDWFIYFHLNRGGAIEWKYSKDVFIMGNKNEPPQWYRRVKDKAWRKMGEAWLIKDLIKWQGGK